MSHTYTKQEPMGYTLIDRIAELEAENAKLRAVAEAMKYIANTEVPPPTAICCDEASAYRGVIDFAKEAIAELEKS